MYGESRHLETVDRVAVLAILDEIIDREISLVKILVAVGTERVLRARVQVIAVAVFTGYVGVHAFQRVACEVVVERPRAYKLEGSGRMAPFANLSEPSVVYVPVAGDAVCELHSHKFHEWFSLARFVNVAFRAFQLRVSAGQSELCFVMIEL